MIKNVLIASSAACMAISVPAAAQDNSSAAGFRVEAIAGYDRIELEIDEEVVGETLKGQKSGAVLGVGAGYDMVFGSFVFGPEGELTFSTVGESVSLDDEEVEGMILDGT